MTGRACPQIYQAVSINSTPKEHPCKAKIMYLCRVRKILIIRFSSIGDIVLTSPLLRAIKTQKPQIEVHYLTKANHAPVLEHNPYIDRLILFQDDLLTTVRTLVHEKYDYIIDLHKNLRTYRIKKAINISSTSFEKLNWEKWLLVKFKINNLPSLHIVQRYFDTLKKISIHDDGKGLEYYNGLEDVMNIPGLPNDISPNYACIVIGGTYFTKQIPHEKLLELIEIIPIPVLLLGGPDDKTIADKVMMQSPKKVYSAVSLSNINESAEILRRCKFVISGDTGLMHIAAAYQKTIFSVWGNTVPEFGMYPYMPEHPERSIIIQNKDVNCRPCSKLGHATCPKNHFKCMLDLDFKALKDYVKTLSQQA
jgi:heptosyltransferase-2